MKKLALILLVLAGCGEQVHVKVNCMTKEGPSVDCTIEQDKGKAEVEVCWDFSAECANGTLVKAPRSCGKVKDGGTAQVTIPGDKLTDVDKCAGDKPPVIKLTNLTIDGKAGKPD